MNLPFPSYAKEDLFSFWQTTSDRLKQEKDVLLSNTVKGDLNNFVVQYHSLFVLIDVLAGGASLMANVHPDPEVRSKAEEIEKQITAEALSIAQDSRLLKPLEVAYAESKEGNEAFMFLTKALNEAKKSGASLSSSDQETLKQLHEKIMTFAQSFSRGIREDARTIRVEATRLRGVSAEFIKRHPPDQEGFVTIGTSYPEVNEIMDMADDAGLRAEMQRLFLQRGYPINKAPLTSLLQTRKEYANLLGYSSWADFVTHDKMSGSAETVRAFLEGVKEQAKDRGHAEIAELLTFKQADDPNATAIFSFEVAYYKNKLRKKRYGVSVEDFRPYFEYTAVRDGLFALCEELFELHFERESLPVWHDDVEVYRVTRTNDGVCMGYIYLDLFPRKDKYSHAAQFTVQSGLRDVQETVAALVCNFAPPEAGKAYFSHDEVNTFFHEFGHLLHTLLGGRHDFITLAGTQVEWDMVEAPSQLFEEWALDAKTLQTFAKHRDTGEIIPSDLVSRLKAADEWGKGIFASHQVFYAFVSLTYHQETLPQVGESETLAALQVMYSALPYTPETYFDMNFGHLEGYSALYYTYLWSLAIARDILQPFEEKGLTNTEVARAYRDCILVPGGSKKATQMFEDFLGRPYSIEPFKKWLAS
jgi:thimet oligopeptidase